MLHWRGSSERLRLQGQPLSWLLARSGLSCRPPNPQAVLVPRNLLAGVAAPLLFCAPACASARRFPLWCAKAHLVSPPHRCHLCPQWPYWCLPLRGRRRKRHARRRFGLKPCADSCRAGRPRWRERGAGYPTLVCLLGSVFSFLRECHRPLAAGAFPPYLLSQRTSVPPSPPTTTLKYAYRRRTAWSITIF